MGGRTPLAPRARREPLILTAVDVVMTDGGIVFSDADRDAKAYDAKDGVGLWIARRAGLCTGVISGRASKAVERRAAELGMEEVHLRVKDKLDTYQRILRRRRLQDSQVCYI